MPARDRRLVNVLRRNDLSVEASPKEATDRESIEAASNPLLEVFFARFAWWRSSNEPVFEAKRASRVVFEAGNGRLLGLEADDVKRR